MVNLFTSNYAEPNESRMAELLTCLNKNITNPIIDKIYIIIEGETKSPTFHEKVVYIRQERPTYADFFKLIRTVSDKHSINILSNSDIYFNDTLSEIYNIEYDEVYALSRHEISDDGRVAFLQVHGYSQDVWLWRGKPKPIDYADFLVGTPACDNRIAYEFENAGYKVYNPSIDIHCLHLHKGSLLGYAHVKKEDKVAEPFRLVPICTIQQIKENNPKIKAKPLSFS